MTNLLIATLLLALFPFSAGGKTYHMTADNSVPAASGTVNAKLNRDNANTDLRLKVKNMARPTALTPAENVYVVWVQPRTGNAIKLGEIGIDNDLKGELRATTTAKDFEIFITGEQSESVSGPSELKLLRAHVNI